MSEQITQPRKETGSLSQRSKGIEGDNITESCSPCPHPRAPWRHSRSTGVSSYSSMSTRVAFSSDFGGCPRRGCHDLCQVLHHNPNFSKLLLLNRPSPTKELFPVPNAGLPPEHRVGWAGDKVLLQEEPLLSSVSYTSLQTFYP